MQLFFGPNDYFFFSDGKGHFRWKAPQAFTDFMNSNSITTVNNLAFGEGDAFFISYTDNLGRHLNHWNSPQGRYAALESWLFREGLPHDRVSTSVSLGPNEAFFAFSDHAGHRWRNIPEAACDYYQKFTTLNKFMRSRVKSIDLGFGDAFLGIGMDNVWFWELGNQYPVLDQMIKQKGITGCKFVVINPFAPNQHFAVFSDDSAHWQIPPHWLAEITKAYQQPAQFGSTFPPVQQPSPPAMHSPPPYSPPGRPQATPHRPSFGNVFNRPQQAQFQPQQYNQQYTQQAYQPQTVTSPNGSKFDWNHAMDLAQSGLDTYNNVTGQGQGGGAGGFVNSIGGNGLMVGQLMGQSAAMCIVM